MSVPYPWGGDELFRLGEKQCQPMPQAPTHVKYFPAEIYSPSVTLCDFQWKKKIRQTVLWKSILDASEIC